MTTKSAPTRTEQVDPHGIDAMRVIPSSFDPEKRTFEVVMSTGAAVRRYSYRNGWYDELLSLEPDHVRLERANSGRMPLLLNHWQWDVDSVVGNIVEGSVRFEEGAMVGLVRMHETEEGEKTMQRIKRGELPNFSVGYRSYTHETVEHDDEPDQRTAVDWEPVELSVVPIPADTGAHTRSASDGVQCVIRSVSNTTMAKPTDGKPAAKGNTKPTESRNADSGDSNPEPANTPPEPAQGGENRAAPSGPTPADAEAARKEGMELERKRSEQIRSAVTKAGLKGSVADDLIQRGVTIEGAREQILEELASTRGDLNIDGHVSVEMEAETKSRMAAERALLHRSDPTTYPIQDGDDARQMAGDTLLDIGLRRLSVAGGDVSQLSRSQRASSVLRPSSQVRGLHTPTDFPLILGNVASRVLRDAYRTIPKSFEAIVRERFVPDFKQVTSVQLGPASGLERIEPDGEYTRGTLSESAESFRIHKYGKIIGVTRETIVNDDLEALARAPRLMGQQAAKTEAKLVWDIITGNPLMADGLPLFHVDHKNVVTGGLDQAGLDLAYTAMRLQTDIDNETEIELMPRTVLVPIEQGNTARRLLVLQTVPTKSEDTNPFQGTMQVVDTAYLSRGSSKDYYVAASTSDIDMVELAFLTGHREPYIETEEGFEVDGIKIKIRHELGAKAIDHRGLVKVVVP